MAPKLFIFNWLTRRSTETKVAVGIFLASFILTLSVLLITSQVIFSPKAVDNRIIPQDVTVSNVYPRGFSVSWYTAQKTRGEIYVSDNVDEIEKRQTNGTNFTDSRGNNDYFTHLIKAENLEVGKKYYFKIVSNGTAFFYSANQEWLTNGIAGSLILPTASIVTESFAAKPVYGTVVNQDETPAKEALIYLEIPDKTSVLSTLSDNEGRWSLDLNNIRRSDYYWPAEYQPGIDLLKLSARNEFGRTSTYRSIPQPEIPEYTFRYPTNPVKLVLLPVPTDIPTLTPLPTSTPLPTATITPTARRITNNPTVTKKPTITRPPTITPTRRLTTSPTASASARLSPTVVSSVTQIPTSSAESPTIILAETPTPTLTPTPVSNTKIIQLVALVLLVGGTLAIFTFKKFGS